MPKESGKDDNYHFEIQAVNKLTAGAVM